MKSRGLIDYSQSEIRIRSRQDMIALLTNNSED